MFKLKAIIIDDEPFAIESLKSLLKDINEIELINTFENPIEAIEFLNTNNLDLLFLDIEMPELSGFDLLKKLIVSPATIITSAYPQYALEGFELDVLDYLIKPISSERLAKAISKALDFTELKKHSANIKPYIFIKCEKILEKVFLEDILYIESLHNYVAIHTTQKRLVSYNSLKNMETILPEVRFIKIQKSYIVNIDKISSIEDSNVLINNTKIPMSRGKKEEILTILRNR